MANKYSEELFGAIDEIIKKRLEKLNKDTTILCSIEDNSEAADGKYTVLNNALRFTAYSENTDYQVGQNVWVLVPDGDYNNTKLIVGKYISDDTHAFTWVDPFVNFVKITSNLTGSIVDETYSLIANDPAITQVNIGNIIKEESLNSIKGLDRIGVSAEFATDFITSNTPFTGNYGLLFQIVTDKDIPLNFLLDVNNMAGNPYSVNSSFFEQKAVFDYSPEEYGNIKSINCTFFQDQQFIGEQGFYNLDEYGDLINYAPDIFMTNLQVFLGYSTNKVSRTTALLSTMDSTLFSVESGYVNKKINPRFVYKNADGTFSFINTYEDFIHPENQNANLKGLTMHLYYQNLSLDSIDPRAGRFYHEAWERKTADNVHMDEDYIWDTWEESDDFKNNFEIPILFDNAQRSYERLKVAFCLKKNDTNLNLIKTRFEAIIKNLNENYEPFLNEIYLTSTDNNFKYKEDDLNVVQILISNAAAWYQDNEEELNKLKNLSNNIYEDFFIDSSSVTSEAVAAMWNYIITLICDTNSDQDNFDYDPELIYEGDTYSKFAGILINGIIKDKYNYAENPIRNFEKAKWILEDIYVSDPLVFTNSTSSGEAVVDLIQGLRLVATDNQSGIYNLYNSSSDTNSGLIKASDTNIRRNIEASFYSLVTGDEDLDKAEHIYWLLPKKNTMIKDPAEGISFGSNNYNALKYTKEEFINWADNYNGNKNNMKLYFKKLTSYYEMQVGEVHGSAEEIKVIKLNGDPEAPTEPNGAAWDKYQISTFFDNNCNKSTQLITLYSATKETLVVLTMDKLPDGASRDSSNIKTYDEFTDGNNNITGVEKSFLFNNLNNYWIIVEDRTSETTEGNSGDKLKKASLTYQIKQTLKKSLTNNKIYASIYKNGTMFPASIELFFGVKGTNGSNYNLSLVPIQEIYDGDKKEAFPNVWTLGSTNSMELLATLYNADDEEVSSDVTYTFKIYKGGEEQEERNYFKVTPNGRKAIIEEKNTSNFKSGIIISCTAAIENENVEVVQYCILPVRTSREYYYLDGPDNVVYNSNNVQPEYYHSKYILKNEREEDIENVKFKLEKIKEDLDENLPTLDNNTLKPTLSYISDANYDFYIRAYDGSYDEPNSNNSYWYQPILVILNNYANTTVNSIINNENYNVSNNTTKNISNVMSNLSNTSDGITGITIGSLPSFANKSRAGILGYLNNSESYGFFQDGTGFIGKNKVVEINDEGNGVLKLPELPVASTSGTGIVKLTSATNSESETLAATAKAVKTTYDLANSKTDNIGTVTSVRVQATSPLASSVNTAQTGTLDTTISLNSAYGDTKNPYGAKSANTILAGPASGNSGIPGFRKLVVADIEDALNGIPIEKLKIKYNNITYNVTPIMLENGVTVLALTL